MTISVISICFNNLADLQKTCASVDGQSLAPYEHWVINGSTSSEIEEWLLKTPQPAYRKWINEKDEGIADAFNKGIVNAGGQLTHLLNAGDQYTSREILEIISGIFDTNPLAQWCSGKIEMVRGGKMVIVGKPFDKSKLYRGMRSVSHPTWFVKKEVYLRKGYYSPAYSIAMDYDMLCRMADEPYIFIDKVLAIFDDTGVSSVHYLHSLEQNRKIYISYFGHSLLLQLWQIRLKLLFFLLQTRLGKWLFTLKKKAGLENW